MLSEDKLFTTTESKMDFLNTASTVTIPSDKPTSDDDNIVKKNKFEDMELNDVVLTAIFRAGFNRPSLSQRVVIPTCLKNQERNICIHAATGSGKTLCFLVVAGQNVNPDIKQTQIVILSTTREVAFQIYNEAAKLFTDSNISVAFHRGTTAGKTKTGYCPPSLERKYMSTNNDHYGHEHIVISNPMRFSYMIKEGGQYVANRQKIQIKLDFVQGIILDEADEMFSTHERDAGTLPIDNILSLIPDTSTQSFYSATMSSNLELRCKQRNAMYLEFLATKDIGNTLTHYSVGLEQEEQKLGALAEIIKGIPDTGTVFVFASSAITVTKIYNYLCDENFSVGIATGQLAQSTRDNEITLLRSGKSKVMVSTDLLGRGIDIGSANLVINYDLPPDPITYKHRVGRAGRFGKKGIAILFYLMEHNNDSKPEYIKEIERAMNINIISLPELSSINKP